MTTSNTGTYIVFVELFSKMEIEVGRLGNRSFRAGTYAYVGSAFGPGGLEARLRRYTRRPRNKHWHIDYLLEHADVWGALVSTDGARLECEWARWFRDRSSDSVKRFGSSDCGCQSHLFFIENRTAGEEIIRAAGCELKAAKMEVDHGL